MGFFSVFTYMLLRKAKIDAMLMRISTDKNTRCCRYFQCDSLRGLQLFLDVEHLVMTSGLVSVSKLSSRDSVYCVQKSMLSITV